MASVTAPAESTLEDILDHPDGVGDELVDGRLVERPTSFLSYYVAIRIARFLGNHCEPSGLAYVFSECGYACFPSHPNRMRRPHVSCIRCDCLAFDQIGEGFPSIRPDLAVEVISPNDRVYDLEEKLDDYRDAAIPLVWLVYPSSKRVRVIRLDGPPVVLGPADVLTAEDVLPGFRCPVSDLFDDPARPEANAGP